ncbi:MAG TPA: sugar phosphate isomerase/epimerase family protein [Steroidobacter sp.]|nr:sugar phosphate isomerase/epimerase family protein [Steroidobacter sp.]
MDWRLRYASHLGFRSLDAPLFAASVGTADPVAHIEFAHRLGFAGVQDALVRQRPSDEADRIGRAFARLSIEPGCVLYAPMEIVRAPLWSSTTASDRELRLRELEAAIEAARRIGARCIAILSGADARVPQAIQLAQFIDSLREAADVAERSDVILCLESTNAQALPGMLLQHIGDAYLVARAVASPRVRLIFDTAHVQIMDGDLLTNLDRVWDTVEIVQVANVPGRVEPEAGEISLAPFLQRLVDRRYRGLVELEHFWAVPGMAAERRGIEFLHELDARLKPR